MHKGNMMPLTGDQMKHTVTLIKMTYFSRFEYIPVITQINNICNRSLVLFKLFNVEKLHIISLK